MAKRRSKSQITGKLNLLAALLAVAAVAFIFAPAIGKGDTVYPGIKATFGTKIMDASVIAQGEIAFNIAAFLGYAAALAGALVAIVFKNKLGAFIATVLCVAAAVLMFLMGAYTYITISSSILNTSVKEGVDWVLQWGAITSGVLLVGAALINLYNAAVVLKR